MVEALGWDLIGPAKTLNDRAGEGFAGRTFLSLLIEQVSDLAVGLGLCKRADLVY